MIDLLPNSIIMSATSNVFETREVALQPSETLKEVRTKSHPNKFPKIMTLFLLDTAHHPRFYEVWDNSVFFSPTFGASSWQSNYKVAGIDYEFLFESYYAIYDASFSIFTPIGEFNGFIGAGLMYHSE
jgi:hypothetical protein